MGHAVSFSKTMLKWKIGCSPSFSTFCLSTGQKYIWDWKDICRYKKNNYPQIKKCLSAKVYLL